MEHQDELQHRTGQITEPEAPEHFLAGTPLHESEGRVFACECGERYVDRSEFDAHIADEREPGFIRPMHNRKIR